MRHSLLLLMTCGIAASSLTISCNSPQPATAPSSQSPGSASPSPSPGGGCSPSSSWCAKPIPDPAPGGQPSPPPSPSSPFALWCSDAAKTSVVTQKLPDLYGVLCAQGQANNFFASTLISSAYAGGAGSPQLYAAGTAADNGDSGGTFRAFYAASIKLPITIESHYQNVAVLDGQVSTIQSQISAEGGKPQSGTSVQPATSSDTDWTRGWTIRAQSHTGGIPDIVSDYVYQEDHYNLASSASANQGLYMYTSALQQSIQTVTDYRVLIAGLDYNGSGYLFVVAKIAANDHGQANQAQSSVQTIASKLISFLYQQSVGH